MPIRTQIWTVSAQPMLLKNARLTSEQWLEDMIVATPALLSDDWMLIGRQESTGQGGRVDLLALAPDASLVLIELKRERTPREVVAQALDYASWVERLEANWRKLVKPEDTIVLAGDISWAMRLTDTRRDFEFLQQLPGQKLIMKGNHDYWWTTANKMNAYLKAEGFDTLHILHNNSYTVEGYALCGTRGWLFDVGEPHDEKVMNREIGRLKMSLDAAEPGLEKLVFLHYPPVYTGTSAPEIVATL